MIWFKKLDIVDGFVQSVLMRRVVCVSANLVYFDGKSKYMVVKKQLFRCDSVKAHGCVGIHEYIVGDAVVVEKVAVGAVAQQIVAEAAFEASVAVAVFRAQMEQCLAAQGIGYFQATDLP